MFFFWYSNIWLKLGKQITYGFFCHSRWFIIFFQWNKNILILISYFLRQEHVLVNHIFGNFGLLNLIKNTHHILPNIIKIIEKNVSNPVNIFCIQFYNCIIDNRNYFSNEKRLCHILYNKSNAANNRTNKHKKATKQKTANMHKRTNRHRENYKYKESYSHLS